MNMWYWNNLGMNIFQWYDIVMNSLNWKRRRWRRWGQHRVQVSTLLHDSDTCRGPEIQKYEITAQSKQYICKNTKIQKSMQRGWFPKITKFLQSTISGRTKHKVWVESPQPPEMHSTYLRIVKEMKNVSVAQKDYSHLFCVPTLCIQSHNSSRAMSHIDLEHFWQLLFFKKEIKLSIFIWYWCQLQKAR